MEAFPPNRADFPDSELGYEGTRVIAVRNFTALFTLGFTTRTRLHEKMMAHAWQDAFPEAIPLFATHKNLFSVLRRSKLSGLCQAAIKNDINFFLDFDFQ